MFKFGESCCQFCPTRLPLVTSAGSGIGHTGQESLPVRLRSIRGRPAGRRAPDRPDSDGPAARAAARADPHARHGP